MTQPATGTAPRRRRSRLKQLLYRPEAMLLAAVSQALGRLSLPNQLRLGALLGRLAWLASPRRRMSIDHARRALGVDAAEARRIARASHLHLGRATVEFLTSTSYLEPPRSESLEVEHFEHLERAVADGRGVVLVTAHLGNWELGAIKQALEGVPILALGREPKNPYVARRLEANRKLCGNEWLPRQKTLLYAAKGLKKGRCVAMAIDQHTRSEPRLETQFLGRPAILSTAVFELAVRLEVPVVPSYTLPKPRGGYRIIYTPALRTSPGGAREDRVRELAGRCHRRAEGWIREHPETWFWFHDLWKGVGAAAATRPPAPEATVRKA